jgi:hypothetical protein
MSKVWNQPTCLSVGEQTKKIWYIYTMELYSAIKENEIMSFAKKMDGTGDYHVK